MTEQRFAIANAGPATPVETAMFMQRTPVPAKQPETMPMKMLDAFQVAYPHPLRARMIPINPPVNPSTIRNTAEADIPSIS